MWQELRISHLNNTYLSISHFLMQSFNIIITLIYTYIFYMYIFAITYLDLNMYKEKKLNNDLK